MTPAIRPRRGCPNTVARLIQFKVVTRTRSGRVKASTIRVLTTLLDHAAFPAAEIAALYALIRWQVEIAYLHLKKTLRGHKRVLRGQSETLARQEVWAFLLVHNMIATVAAKAAALARIDPDEVSFTAVLGPGPRLRPGRQALRALRPTPW